MSTGDHGNRAGVAILIAGATAVASYLPAAYVYDRLTSRPMRHGEDVMGRGLEVLFIGGPIGALSLGAIVGYLTYRGNDRASLRMAVAFIVGCCLLSFAIARWTKSL